MSKFTQNEETEIVKVREILLQQLSMKKER